MRVWMKKPPRVRLIAGNLITSLILMTLLALPFLHFARLTAVSSRVVCSAGCGCCHEAERAAAAYLPDLTSRCCCDISEPEPVTDIPPLVSPPYSRDSENMSPVPEEKFQELSISVVKAYLKVTLFCDEPGPPLYLVHTSLLI